MREDDLHLLQEGIAALGLTLAADVPERLIAYRDLLLKWNRAYNLTALTDPAEAVTHHLLDSLAILPHVLERTQGRPTPSPSPALLDVGSGAGLPGIPLALACPELRVTLIDAVQKKTAFQQQAIIELALTNARAQHGRVEDQEGRYDLIVARAFAELPDFVRLTRHLLAPGGVWLAMKGRNPEAELARLPPDLYHTVAPLQVPGLAAERHLVVLRPES